MPRYRNALIISDTQAPFHHRDTIRFLAAVGEAIDARDIYHVGDELDLYWASRFPKATDAPGGELEFRQSRRFIESLNILFPDLRLCHSNHGNRILKAAELGGIYSAWVRSMHEVFDLPGWRWSDEWIIPWARGECVITHGEHIKGAFRRSAQLGTSVASGHHHTMFGLSYVKAGGFIRFGMDVGCLIDENAVAMRYGSKAAQRPQLGCGAVVDGWPRLFPMEVNAKNRWTGRII